MKKKFYIEGLFLVILGIVTSLSLPPFNYIFVNFFTYSSFFIFLIKKIDFHNNKYLFFLYGWLFGFGYFFTNLYWISISLSFDENFKFLIPLSLILIPSFLALFYGLVSYLFVIFKTKKIIISFFVFSLIFGSVEFFRGTILTGFPWNLIAYSFSNQIKILSIISLIGTYGFNLFCISLFTSPALLILKNSKKNLIICVFFFITSIVFQLYGIFYEKKFNKIEKKTYDYKIRIIGSQISLDRFYSNVDPISVIEELIQMSNPDLNKKIVFVWPEGIIPGLSQENLIEYKWLFDDKFNENHILLVGTKNYSIENGSKKYYNSLTYYNNQLEILDFYNKIKLVPFGEFLPFEKVLKKLGLKSITNNYESFSKGKKRNIIEIRKKDFSIKILPLICYEIIYSGKLFKETNFDFILNISEDGWFGGSIGPKQHLVHSTYRAIESGKYVLRSSNNGFAAIVNPLGEIEQSINLGRSGYIDYVEYKKIQPTIFSKYGNKIFGLLILLYIFIIFSFNKMENE